MAKHQVSTLGTRVRFPPPALSSDPAASLERMKLVEREQARALRREQGQSIKEIAASLRVSTSSVSQWVRGIELSDGQIDALRQRNPALNGQLIGVKVRADLARSRRAHAQAEGRIAARRGECLHAAGCMLFWAEGSRNRNSVRFTNSDPEMVVYFARFLCSYFVITNEMCRVWCNLHADHLGRQREVEDFWLQALKLPRECLTRSTVNRRSRASRARSERTCFPTEPAG